MKYQDKLESLHEYVNMWCQRNQGPSYQFKVTLDDALRVQAQVKVNGEWTACGARVAVEVRSNLRLGTGVSLVVYVSHSICGAFSDERERLAAIVALERLASKLHGRVSDQLFES